MPQESSAERSAAPVEYVFSISTGRSGSDYLATLFRHVTGCLAFHEPTPQGNGTAMRAFARGDTRAMRRIALAKVEKIRELKRDCRVYAETNHCFIKGFGWLLPELLPEDRMGVVILRRDPVKVAESTRRIGCSPLLPEGRRWIITPDAHAPLVRPPSRLLSPTATYRAAYAVGAARRTILPLWRPALQREPARPSWLEAYESECLAWYVEETAAQARAFQQRFPRIRYYEVNIDRLNAPEEVQRMLDAFGLIPAASLPGVVGRATNQKQAKVTAPGVPDGPPPGSLLYNIRERREMRARLAEVRAREFRRLDSGRMAEAVERLVQQRDFMIRSGEEPASPQELVGCRFHFLDFYSLELLFHEIFYLERYYFEARDDQPVILDCGSAIGVSTLYFKMLYPRARIVAFEPFGPAFRVLERNVADNGLSAVTPRNAGLSETGGPRGFHYDPSAEGRLRMASGQDRTSDSAIVAETVRLSQQVDGEIDLVRLDVAGAEIPVLQEIYASGKIRSIRQMLVKHPYGSGDPRHALLTALLKKGGFTCEARGTTTIHARRA